MNNIGDKIYDKVRYQFENKAYLETCHKMWSIPLDQIRYGMYEKVDDQLRFIQSIEGFMRTNNE